jgi:hypothetical protein
MCHPSACSQRLPFWLSADVLHVDATCMSNYRGKISVPGFESINMAEYVPGDDR